MLHSLRIPQRAFVVIACTFVSFFSLGFKKKLFVITNDKVLFKSFKF